MDTLTMSSAVPELGVRATHSAPIVVATDGRTQSDSALVVGRLFAQSANALRLVTVLKPLPIIPDAQPSVTQDLEAARQTEVRREVVGQMRRTWGDEFDIEVRQGDPATVIARMAHTGGATMIVAGLGRHRVSDRVFGDETALRLIRMSDVPVFAAANGLNRAPRRIVVAVDFTETSLRAARLSLSLAGAGATVYLAHVAPRDSSLYDWESWGAVYKQNAGDALQKTRDQLRVPKDTIVQNVELQGDPATELLAFAASVNADLIATGSHGHGFVARMLIGSVTTRIVRCSSCSVLTIPHSAAMTRARTTAEPPVRLELANDQWATQLDEFTQRNAGRPGTLEVDDPELGAQAQEFGYPLIGATFHRNSQRVELTFGDARRAGHQLTRSMCDVTGIDVLRNDTGRDLALRIGHGTGWTLLTFAS
jgi:nucleotide-binding universal stress UspA family protein